MKTIPVVDVRSLSIAQIFRQQNALDSIVGKTQLILGKHLNPGYADYHSHFAFQMQECQRIARKMSKTRQSVYIMIFNYSIEVRATFN